MGIRGGVGSFQSFYVPNDNMLNETLLSNLTMISFILTDKYAVYENNGK